MLISCKTEKKLRLHRKDSKEEDQKHRCIFKYLFQYQHRRESQKQIYLTGTCKELVLFYSLRKMFSDHTVIFFFSLTWLSYSVWMQPHHQFNLSFLISSPTAIHIPSIFTLPFFSLWYAPSLPLTFSTISHLSFCALCGTLIHSWNEPWGEQQQPFSRGAGNSFLCLYSRAAHGSLVESSKAFLIRETHQSRNVPAGVSNRTAVFEQWTPRQTFH